MIGLDTCTIIDYFRNNLNLKKLMDSIGDIFVSTTINYWEIKGGLNPKDKNYIDENKYFEDFFKDIIIFDFDKNSVRISSETFWELANKGEMIDDFDAMIAGAFLSNGVDTIITKNKKHFERIKGLKVLSY